MRNLEKLLLIAGASMQVQTGSQLQKLLSAWAVMTTLVIIASMLLSAIVIAGIYTVYLLLLNYYGLTIIPALLISMLAALSVVVILIMITCKCAGILKSNAKTPMDEALDAFLRGLLSKD